MNHRAQLTYAFDAYCGWCYGFDPALHSFAEANAERIELRVLSSGLFTGSQARARHPVRRSGQRLLQLTPG